jgi:hypothetical protein
MPSEILAIAKPLHAKFGKAAVYLWADHPKLGPVVADIRKGSGYLDMADDLARYAVLFDENWKAATGRCDITPDDIKTAKSTSTVILEALSDTSDEDVDTLKDLRTRAAEYLRRGADDIRDAATYIFRKEPDSLSRYPSLHKPSSSSRKKSKSNGATPPAETDTDQSAPQ